MKDFFQYRGGQTGEIPDALPGEQRAKEIENDGIREAPYLKALSTSAESPGRAGKKILQIQHRLPEQDEILAATVKVLTVFAQKTWII